MATAPSNGGFTVTGPGWVRVRLADDPPRQSDIWARPGQHYPLRVSEYEIPATGGASGLSWLPEDLGGYCRSKSFDEGEEQDISGSIGFYAGASGTATVDGSEVTLEIGDFWAGSAETAVFGGVNFLTAIY